MSSSYIAFYAPPALVNEVREIDWDSQDEVQSFFKRVKDSDGLLRVWGPGTDGWIFSALTNWLAQRYGIPDFGSKLGGELVNDCEYIHWVLEPQDQVAVSATLNDADPRNDETFAPTVSEYFESLGSDYVEGYVDEGFDEYYQTFDELRADLNRHDDKTLIVMIPF